MHLTLLAGVGFDTAMGSRMSVQVGASCEMGRTLSTGKWFFARVHSHVAHKVSVVFEDAGAKLAGELFTAGSWFVQPVTIQPLLPLESCATVRTHKPALIPSGTGVTAAVCSVAATVADLAVRFTVDLALFLVRRQSAGAEKGLAALVA